MVTLAVGTEKGAWLLRHSAAGDWDVQGPLFGGWKVTAFATTASGRHLAALGSNWFGAAIQQTTDLDDPSSWQQVVDGPAWPSSAGRKLTQIWTFATAGDRMYAGVDEAGLFLSHDDGASWHPVDALNEHESRPTWGPGLGGLCAHHVLTDNDRIWVAISAVGVFRSDDGGRTFARIDDGVDPVSPEENADNRCVHGLVADPEQPDHIWRQDHRGTYRTLNGGDRWERIQEGLPATAGFGFPVARDHASGRLFVVPLHSDETRFPVDGRLAAYCSDDDGDSWRVAGTGWAAAPSYDIVLRRALATDQRGGVYLGTTSGRVWASDDVGDTWAQLPGTFPRILTVHPFVEGD